MYKWLMARESTTVSMCVCVCACAYVRVCVRACVRACVRVFVLCCLTDQVEPCPVVWVCAPVVWMLLWKREAIVNGCKLDALSVPVFIGLHSTARHTRAERHRGTCQSAKASARGVGLCECGGEVKRHVKQMKTKQTQTKRKGCTLVYLRSQLSLPRSVFRVR